MMIPFRNWNRWGIVLSALVFMGTACRDRRNPHVEECVCPVGGLLFSRESIVQEVVYAGKMYTDTVWVYNPAADSCLVLPKGSNGLECSLPEEKIPPGGCVPMIISLRKGEREVLGSFFDVICFRINGREEVEGRLIVRGCLVENFDGRSDLEKQQVPDLYVAADRYDFGTIRPDEVVRIGFPLANRGNGVLIIRQIECSCGCLQPVTPCREIAPGDSLLLELDFRASDKEGIQQRAVALICNDPARPVVKLSVTGNIEKNNNL